MDCILEGVTIHVQILPWPLTPRLWGVCGVCRCGQVWVRKKAAAMHIQAVWQLAVHQHVRVCPLADALSCSRSTPFAVQLQPEARPAAAQAHGKGRVIEELLQAPYKHIEAEQQQAPNTQGKLQHLKAIVVTMRNPLLLQHQYSSGGFPAQNTRTWLWAYADTLMHVPQVWGRNAGVGRFAAGDFLAKLRAGHSRGHTGMQQHLHPQLVGGNKDRLQATPWIAQ